MVNKNDYFSEQQWTKLKKFSENNSTPCQYIFKDIVEQNYNILKTNLNADIFYAIKANPNKEILSLLRDKGSNFDIASKYQLDKVLSLNISPQKISYGNTIKKANDIKYFYDKGVRLFVTDSLNDLNNIAIYAPKSKIFCRILVDELATSDWPLSKKFGCDLDMAYDLLIEANKKNLIPYGVSFHVGSQQRDVTTWHAALIKVKYLFDQLNKIGIKLKMINMGGGFPIHYLDEIKDTKQYCKIITEYIQDVFGKDIPRIIIEPGRSLVGNAGILITEIVNISKKSKFSSYKWLYIDCGKFNGLAETLDESIKYPIYCDKNNKQIEYIIAGNTCDSADTLYEKYKYQLPQNLCAGDKLYWFSTGAYTASYSAIEFNGFPPLRVEVI